MRKEKKKEKNRKLVPHFAFRSEQHLDEPFP